MKLLFDQNISFRAVKKLKNDYPYCQHVNNLGLSGAPDKRIWNLAQKEGYAIVTFDADFSDLAVLKGVPPKVIWLRLGNVSTQQIIDLFILNKDAIEQFCNHPKHQNIAVLEITSNH